jgi:hypothetical protein
MYSFKNLSKEACIYNFYPVGRTARTEEKGKLFLPISNISAMRVL